MRECNDTNAENTLDILRTHLGPVFNTLSESTVENLVEAFGTEFDTMFEHGQENGTGEGNT